MSKTKIEKYMPMILSFKEKAKSYGLKDEEKLANELLKELKGNEENFDETKLEVLNYALYKANKVVKVKKYISEDIVPFEQAYLDAYHGKNILAIAPTGSGKAYSSNKTVKKYSIPILNVLSSASIIEQQGNNYKIMSAYGKIKEDETKSLEYCLNKSKIVGATWNKLSDLARNKTILDSNMDKLSERVLSIDEAHEQFTNGFRADRAEDINRLSQSKIFRGAISMTGTTNRLEFDKYDEIIEYISDSNIDYKVFIYDTVSDDFIINHVNNEAKGRFTIFKDSIKDLTYLASEIKHKVDVIHASNKEESQLYKNLMTRETFGRYRGLLCTSTMLAGFNANDKDVTDVYIIGVKDPAKLKQICARYREVEELNVHIFNTYPKKQKDFCYIESRINYIIESTQSIVENRNRDIDNLGLDYVVQAHEYRAKSEDEIFFDTKTNRYKVNKTAIRTKVYDNYYEQRNRKQFEVLLREYFTNITITNLNVEKEDNKNKIQFIENMDKESKEQLSKLEPFKECLVLAHRICNNLKLNKDQQSYLKNTGFTEEGLRITYKTLGVYGMLDNLLFKTHNVLYTDLVVDKHFENDIAWKIAGLTESEVKKIDEKIKIQNYLYERKHNNEQMAIKARMFIEHQRIEYILSLDLEGAWLTKEHFNLILEEYKKANPKDINIKSVHLKAIIENMYNVVRRTDCSLDSKFYKDLVPDFKNKKKITAYNCKEKTTPEDIADIIGVASDNKTLIDLIQGKKSL